MKIENSAYFKGFTSKYFTTKDGVNLHYLQKGTGMPLIMVHGWNGSARDFIMNAQHLSEFYTVFVLELRGHGYSDSPDSGQRISRLAKDIHEFVLYHKMEKANFIGFSMGASVLWSYLDLFGEDRINKMIFVDEAPAFLANPEDTETELKKYAGNNIDFWDLSNSFARDGNEAIVNRFGKYFRRGNLINNPDVSKVLDKIINPPINKQFLAKLFRDHLFQDWRDVFKNITIPVLLLTGDVSHVTSEESNSWMLNIIKDCKRVRFSEKEYGNHFLLQNCSEKVNQEINKFLQ